MRLNRNIENDFFLTNNNLISRQPNHRATERARDWKMKLFAPNKWREKTNNRYEEDDDDDEKIKRNSNDTVLFYLLLRIIGNRCEIYSFRQIENTVFHLTALPQTKSSTQMKQEIRKRKYVFFINMYATYMQRSNRFRSILHLRQGPIYTSLCHCCSALHVRQTRHIRPRSGHGQSICIRDSCRILETIGFLVARQVSRTYICVCVFIPTATANKQKKLREKSDKINI